MPGPPGGKASATPAALDLLAEIIADHGPVLIHQSGGCCDGSSPMCYPAGEFLIGDGDILLIGHSTSGEIAMLANNDPELRAKLNGRYFGWGSGGPATHPSPSRW